MTTPPWMMEGKSLGILLLFVSCGFFCLFVANEHIVVQISKPVFISQIFSLFGLHTSKDLDSTQCTGGCCEKIHSSSNFSDPWVTFKWYNVWPGFYPMLCMEWAWAYGNDLQALISGLLNTWRIFQNSNDCILKMVKHFETLFLSWIWDNNLLHKSICCQALEQYSVVCRHLLWALASCVIPMRNLISLKSVISLLLVLWPVAS